MVADPVGYRFGHSIRCDDAPILEHVARIGPLEDPHCGGRPS